LPRISIKVVYGNGINSHDYIVLKNIIVKNIFSNRLLHNLVIFLIKKVMEIKEIVSYSVLPNANTLEVAFRTIDDSDEEIRNVELEYDIVSEYGYQLETETFDMFLMDDDDDFQIEKEESLELDQDELISFLNEYFTVNPDKVPTASIF
jgi:hypothetical protein